NRRHIRGQQIESYERRVLPDGGIEQQREDQIPAAFGQVLQNFAITLRVIQVILPEREDNHIGAFQTSDYRRIEDAVVNRLAEPVLDYDFVTQSVQAIGQVFPHFPLTIRLFVAVGKRDKDFDLVGPGILAHIRSSTYLHPPYYYLGLLFVV